MRSTLRALSVLLLPFALSQHPATIYHPELDIDVILPGLPVYTTPPQPGQGSDLGHSLWIDGFEIAIPGKRDLRPSYGQGSNLGHTEWIDGSEVASPGRRDLAHGSNMGHTVWVDGVELAVPGKRQRSFGFTPQPKRIEDIVLHADGGSGYHHPRAAAAAALRKRAPKAGRLFGDSGLPHWTDPRQNESVASCGLTSAMQSLAFILPELVAANLFIEENAAIDATGGPEAVLVGVTDWTSVPLTKSAVTVAKASLNSTNMMATDIWWPGAFEKSVEALGQNTTYMLPSRAMTMISGLDASFNLTTNTNLAVARGASGEEETWAVLARCQETPITVQTFWNVTGVLQANHVFTAIRAEEVAGVRMLTLHNPHGWDDVLPFDLAWPQIYLYAYLTSFPNRGDFGLADQVISTPYTLVPPSTSSKTATTRRPASSSKAVEAAAATRIPSTSTLQHQPLAAIETHPNPPQLISVVLHDAGGDAKFIAGEVMEEAQTVAGGNTADGKKEDEGERKSPGASGMPAGSSESATVSRATDHDRHPKPTAAIVAHSEGRESGGEIKKVRVKPAHSSHSGEHGAEKIEHDIGGGEKVAAADGKGGKGRGHHGHGYGK